MTADQLKDNGVIYFEHVRQGLEDYHSEIRKMDAAEACRLFLDMWNRRGGNEAFLDFYYYRLDREARLTAESVLTDKEKEYLKKIEPDNDIVIFPMDELLLRIATRLNETAMLFSTVYLSGSAAGSRSTWWGNYNQEYIVFTDK